MIIWDHEIIVAVFVFLEKNNGKNVNDDEKYSKDYRFFSTANDFSIFFLPQKK